MKRILLLLSLSCLSLMSYAQIGKDYLVTGSVDLIKAGYADFFQRAQLGTEFNYFLNRDFTATGGVDYWTEDGFSVVIGTRWYPTREAFIRLRGLLGADDVAIGGGWAKPLKNNFYFEAMGDYYFDGQFAIRAGFSFLIKRD